MNVYFWNFNSIDIGYQILGGILIFIMFIILWSIIVDKEMRAKSLYITLCLFLIGFSVLGYTKWYKGGITRIETCDFQIEKVVETISYTKIIDVKFYSIEILDSKGNIHLLDDIEEEFLKKIKKSNKIKIRTWKYDDTKKKINFYSIKSNIW